MKIYLMQHAKAKSEAEDIKRPLSDEGKNDLKKITGFLKNLNLYVSHIFHSEKLRAKETADIVSKAVNSKEGIKEIKGLNPNDDPSDILALINKEDKDLLFIGHLPFMNKLINLLITGEENSDIISFSPGSFVCLEKNEQMNKFSLSFIIKPDIL